jgi:glycosyltransferase involved in cell wall biosynthesis
MPDKSARKNMAQQSQVVKPVIIMPIHLKSVLLYHALTSKGIQVLGFWDNDEALNGESYDGVGISLPVSADIFSKDVTIIIQAQLESLGHSDIISAQMISVYKAKERLYNYYPFINRSDLTRVKPRYMPEIWLWVNQEQCVPLSGLSPEEYSDAIISATKPNYGNDKECTRRKILLISDGMAYTGALIALKNAALAFRDNGDIPVILCKSEGNFLIECLKDRISVLIDPLMPKYGHFTTIASIFDMIIVNTMFGSSISAINKLCSLSMPVMWWIHEAKHFYEAAAELPQHLGENIHVYCVSEHAKKAFIRADLANLGINPEIMFYGIKDATKPYRSSNRTPLKTRLMFMTIGFINERKGQDILCASIRSMDKSIREKCEFVFIGKPSIPSNRIHNEVLSLKQDFPAAITLIEHLSRDEIYEAISQIDCMICTSRDDPLPIFITEAMMFKKICICSENTGTAALIEHGENGFVYSKNDPEQLRCLIEHVASSFEDLQKVGEKSRRIYDEHFSYDVFEQTFLNTINAIYNSQLEPN